MNVPGESVPDDLRFSPDHEWVSQPDPESGLMRVGITDHAQSRLGDVVYVDLPDVGAAVRAGEPCGEVESTKSVSDLIAPVAGTVAARNELLGQRPELVNEDPYGEGWMIQVRAGSNPVEDDLLDAEQYRGLLAGDQP